MKKLLTVSLFAVMAVSAANAKIASTDYVDNTVSPVATKVGSAEFTKGVAVDHKGNVTAAIDAVAEVVAGLSGEGGEVAGALAEAKSYADSLAGNYDAAGSATTAESNANAYTDQKVAAEAATARAAEKANADAIVDMKNAEIQGSLANLIKAEETRATAAEGALSTRIDTLSTQGGKDGQAIAQLQEDVVANADDIADMKDASIDGSLANLIADEAARADAAEKANAQAITDMKDADLDGSLANLIKDEETRAKAAEEKIAEYDAQDNLIGGTVKELDTNLKQYADTAEADAIATADTAAKAMIQLTQAMADCADKQCALTINEGNILWEEVINQ